MKLDKILTIVLWVLLAVSAVLLVSMMVNLGNGDTDPTLGAWISTNLTWSYILLGAGIVFALVFTAYHTLTDKEAAKRGLIALVFVVVVLGLSYFTASDAIPQFHGVDKFVADGTLTNTVSKWIGTTLNATYILLFLAILSVVFSSVSRIFK